MKRLRINLYLFYVLLAMAVLALASCASDDMAVTNDGQRGSRMSLGIDVAQIQGGDATRAKAQAPAIKSCQMKTSGKPVYVQCSSEAYIGKHADCHAETGVDEKQTRGVSVTSDTFYDQFGLFYYDYAKTENWADIASSRTPTGYNLAVKKSDGWHTDKYWPGIDHRLTFIGYAPYDADYKNASGTKYIQLASNIKGYPSLTYTVPDKVEDQQDLLVSVETATQDMDGDYNKVIGMKFHHVLSAINFKIGSTMAPGRIAKIEVRGVRNKGVYNFKTQTWSSISGAANYTITPGYIINDQRGVVFTGVDDSKNDLMLVMPQTVPSGAKIIVTIEDGANYANSHEMELPIDGHEWQAGYTITYSLSTSEENSDYIFSVSKINSIDKAESTVSYKVSSYMQSYYGSQTPVGWTAKYAVDDAIEANEYSEDYGDVVTSGFIYDMDSPTATTSSLTATISELEPPISDPAYNSHTKTLRARTPVGTKEAPYDLSTFGDTKSRSTANCYVVNAPGWYKFPIVYGNCIKNGSNNTAVYGTQSPKTSFVNHLNRQITSPYLKNNSGVSPHEAILVWQDAYKMIDVDSVEMTSDQSFVVFKVNADNICQGNALLSVRDANKTILWNWHIWVTDEDISSATDIPVTNQQNSVYNFMKVPLGFCEKDRRKYTPRRIKFQFEQNDSRQTANITFNQTTTSYVEAGINAPYYQYGRSVPLRIQNGLTLTSKTIYLHEGYTQNSIATTTTIGGTIQNPTTEYYNGNNGEWNSTYGITNLWDANCTQPEVLDKSTRKTVKTIYDPSPAGYKLPETAAYSGFAPNPGSNIANANCNIYSNDTYEIYFYTQLGKKGNVIRFPKLGYFFTGSFYNDAHAYWLTSPARNSKWYCGTELAIYGTYINSCVVPQRYACVSSYPVSDD